MTRRDLLAATITGALPRGGAAFAAASQPSTPVNFGIPPHACDCHTHIIGDAAGFPFFAGRTYTPEPALPAEMSAVHRALHIERVVIVTPSVYGTDNSATLYGMKARGRNARGIAVIDEKTPDNLLDSMGKAGVRGIRLNLVDSAQGGLEAGRRRFQAAAQRMKVRDWHIQIFTSPAVISGMKDLVGESPVPVVFDHFAGANAALGVQQTGFADVLELVRSGKAWVKVSGAYRASAQAPDYPDAAPLAKALIGTNPDRIIWGTDWPHPDSSPRAGRRPTDLAPLLQIDDGRMLNQLAVWAPDAKVRKKILVDNPALLYGF